MPLDEPAWWYGDDRHGIATWLSPIASIYGWAAASRYSWASPYRSRLPVICVGNFTAGGTGKTPLAMYLCERLLHAEQRPVVLTRGYGGRHAGPHWVGPTDRPSDVGDEAILLARVAPTLVARDRGAGARAIELEPDKATAIVMDDGLQNPQLAKNLTIAVVEGSRGLGNSRVIPAGPLRGALEFQLSLADVVVVNAAPNGSGDGIADFLRHRFNGPVLRSSTEAASDTSWLKGQRVVAWAGIGAPLRFFAMLESLGADVQETIVFRDHQHLGQTDAERLLEAARLNQALLVSTEKDLARLSGATGRCAELAAATRALPVRVHFAEAEAERFDALIASALKDPAY